MAVTDRWLSYVTILQLFIPFSASLCGPKPVSVPIQDVLLSNGKRIRGISMGMGDASSQQNFSFFASGGKNETYIYSRCNGDFTSDFCITAQGGHYDPDLSTSDKSLKNHVPNDVLKEEFGDARDFGWMTDTMRVQPDVSLENFTFGIPDTMLEHPYTSQAQIGLNRNSTILHALKNAGKISSLTWSLFWGLVGGDGQHPPGSLVFGGVDQSLIGSRKNYTADLNFFGNCTSGMLVTLSDIALDWPNGTKNSIFSGAQSEAGIRACIEPQDPALLTLPLTNWDTFRELAGLPSFGRRSFGTVFYTMLFGPDEVYDGDLTLSIDNKIAIRIPNSELVVSQKTISDAGEVRTNTSERNLVMNSLQSTNLYDLPKLGRLFLSSAYLSVNHDAGTFSLWQADTEAGTKKLVALDERNNVIEEFCATDGNRIENGNGTQNGTIETPSSNPPDSSPALTTGTIAGIAVGGAVGLGVLLALVWCLLVRRRKCLLVRRRKKRNMNANFEDSPPEYRPEVPPVEMYVNDNKFEVESRVAATVAELDGGRMHQHTFRG